MTVSFQAPQPYDFVNAQFPFQFNSLGLSYQLPSGFILPSVIPGSYGVPSTSQTLQLDTYTIEGPWIPNNNGGYDYRGQGRIEEVVEGSSCDVIPAMLAPDDEPLSPHTTPPPAPHMRSAVLLPVSAYTKLPSAEQHFFALEDPLGSPSIAPSSPGASSVLLSPSIWDRAHKDALSLRLHFIFLDEQSHLCVCDAIESAIDYFSNIIGDNRTQRRLCKGKFYSSRLASLQRTLELLHEISYSIPRRDKIARIIRKTRECNDKLWDLLAKLQEDISRMKLGLLHTIITEKHGRAGPYSSRRRTFMNSV